LKPEIKVERGIIGGRIVTVVVLSTLVLAMLACGPLTTVLGPTETSTPAEVFPVETPPTEAPTSTTVPSPTSTLIATATELPATPTPPPTSPACPPPGSPRLIRPADFADYPDAIQQYLSAGGSVVALRGTLTEWSALPDAENQVVAADLTGDGGDEVIVALAHPDAQTIVRPGVLLIFGCSEGRYTSLHREGNADPEMFDPAVQLVQVGDTNLDDSPDVTYVLRTCGAHTCFERLNILGWNGTRLASLMGGTLDLPYPTYTVEPGQIEAISGGIGSVGAEPQRGYAEIWTWNGDVFTITETIHEPAVYRYHALLDGDRALRAGDYVSATEMYRRVIDDDALESFVGVISQADGAGERAFLTAFARWRLLLTYLHMGDVGSAQAEINRLQADYPPGEVGHEVVEMALTFWEVYLQGEGIVPACSEIVAAAERYASVLEFFNNNYGYANPWWEPEDLCLATEQR
jgi:hypothetical protein